MTKERSKPEPKFSVGDGVTVSGHGPGEIAEVACHDGQHFFMGNEQLYSVKLAPWDKEEFKDANGNVQVRYKHPKTGETRGHESDVLGNVQESDLTARKGK